MCKMLSTQAAGPKFSTLHSSKKPDTAGGACNVNAGEVEAERFLGFAKQQRTLSQKPSSNI